MLFRSAFIATLPVALATFEFRRFPRGPLGPLPPFPPVVPPVVVPPIIPPVIPQPPIIGGNPIYIIDDNIAGGGIGGAIGGGISGGFPTSPGLPVGGFPTSPGIPIVPGVPGVPGRARFQERRPLPNVQGGKNIGILDNPQLLSPGGRQSIGNQNSYDFQAVKDEHVGNKQKAAGPVDVLGQDAELNLLHFLEDINLDGVGSQKTKYKVNPNKPETA